MGIGWSGMRPKVRALLHLLQLRCPSRLVPIRCPPRCILWPFLCTTRASLHSHLIISLSGRLRPQTQVSLSSLLRYRCRFPDIAISVCAVQAESERPTGGNALVAMRGRVTEYRPSTEEELRCYAESTEPVYYGCAGPNCRLPLLDTSYTLWISDQQVEALPSVDAWK